MSYIFETYQQKHSNEDLKNIFNVTSSSIYDYPITCNDLRLASPYCLIYKDPDCMWHSKPNEYGWLIFDFPEKITITGYRIFPTDCCRLKNHLLKGSNNGVEWTEIVHTTSNTPDDNLGHWVVYNTMVSSYKMYKIEEEQSELGTSEESLCTPYRYFGLLKVDFFTVKYSELIGNNILKEMKSCLIISRLKISILFILISNIFFTK